MISAKRKPDGTYVVIGGTMRLKALLQLQDKAEVLDVGTGKAIHVHEIDGKLVALSEDNQENLEDLANFTINKAKR
jgi:hypothetical protein